MTKRYGDFDNISNKKPKFDELWEEDLDSDIIDDCFQLAIQVCENEEVSCTQRNNITLLPTYNAFKNRKPVSNSTQLDVSYRMPSTSNNNIEEEISELKAKYTEREGEVAILRTQIKEFKLTTQQTQQRKQIEWQEKIDKCAREMKAVKTELEFKNLEIVNLRQHYLDISKKRYLVTEKSSNLEQSKIVEKTSCNVTNFHKQLGRTNLKIIPHMNAVYPLKLSNFLVIYEMTPNEKYYSITKYRNRNTIPYLQNQLPQKEASLLTKLQPLNIKIDKKDLNFEYIYPEISNLHRSSLENLNSEESDKHINKILLVTVQFLIDFRNYLNFIKDICQLQEIQEIDARYIRNNIENAELLCDEIHFSDKELGIKSGKCIKFISEVLPYNNYLQNILLTNKKVPIKENDEFVNKNPFAFNHEAFHFLNLVLEIVKIIGKIRKAYMCTGFLCSITDFLIHSFKCKYRENDILFEIMRELLYARPNFQVICRFTFLLKTASQYSEFVEFLCCKRTQNHVENNFENGVFYINQDSSVFHLFTILFENMLLKVNNLPLNVGVNLISFVYNVFNSNAKWLYQQQGKECNCLSQLYKLAINIIFVILEKYKETRTACTDKYSDIFKICLKILSVLIFNSYDLLENYITVYSQYKEILRSFSELQDDLKFGAEHRFDLEKLNICEDMPNIPQENYKDVEF